MLAPFDKPVATWASENAQALLDSDFAPNIAKNGIWIIQHTWVTDECAINVTNSSDKEIEVGLDIAATGIVKVGAGGGTFDKLKNEGWTTYQSEGVGEHIFARSRANADSLCCRMTKDWLFVLADLTSSLVGSSDSPVS